MDSMFLAKLLGMYYLVVGISRFINRQTFIEIKDNLHKNVALMFYKRVLIFIFGAYVVLKHNIWEADWTLIITAIGWTCFIKGAILIMHPSGFCKHTHTPQSRQRIMLIYATVMCILGGILTFFGFFA